MSTQEAQDLVVRKSVVVDCSPEHAFEVFTDRLDTWWPFESHRPGEAMPVSATFEPRIGGRVYHTLADGKELEWATVLVWEPPARFVVDWHVTPSSPPTELEVRFVPESDGTRVELEHRGWERYGERATEVRASYNEGWDVVLKPFVASAGS
ncbi:MAG TPA: SRPBCC family protein [Gaiellaceae bacterium]|nr:SRPBCC family protein [Gaiellaceae bacterium]